ncbi:hypothetical protein Vretimale_12421 [Volvox reticuliferus]|uniref:Uncharacterized protein n=1 Tax=Volvox reticuliferus TaxID=1737510 RepID=A0A8J4CCG7_9CHLO|nr:hypothetical protein Vretifemale_9095 [Volvox reticuliferus]GIM08413.1 hypothetical protein Vretimale_12421 [Volvox reticuliferus]
MLLRCAAILSPPLRRQGAKPVHQHVTALKRHVCLSVLARSSNNAVDAIRKGLAHIPDADLQQALAEYPDLGGVDEEYVALWLASAASLLNLTADEVQSYVRMHPWLLIADLLVIKTLVIALTRVMSVDEGKVARMALSHPDILELEPMDLMEHLVYLSNTTGMSYNAVVQLTLGCPAIALSQPRDVVRAWAQVRSCCSQSEMATAAATRDADRAQPDYGRQEELGGNLNTSNMGELEDDFDLEAAVLKVLAARPELLTMGNEEIRKSLAPIEAAGAPTLAAAAPSLRTSARPPSMVAGATPLPRTTPLPPSKLLRPRAVRRRVPRKGTRDGSSGAGGEGENAVDSDKVATDPQ